MSDIILEKFLSQRYEFELFMEGVEKLFLKHPSLNKPDHPIVHSTRSRVKNTEHLRAKISRKMEKGDLISEDNCFERITDYAAIRVLHLRQIDAREIKTVVDDKIKSGDWFLNEPPIAYTWDPEYKNFFEQLGCECRLKESSYTSIHFVVRPKKDSIISCEIQVRTLFEEIWGEVDHHLNYPIPTTNINCKEQLSVLAKVVGAGSRLATSIYNSTTHKN
ncbi:RelA/SpoT domain-containing protein [Methylorubrum extorquens]